MAPDFDRAKELFVAGTSALEKMDLASAEVYLTECLKLIPDRESTKINLSVLFLLKADHQADLGCFSDALFSYEQAISFNNRNAIAWSNKGAILSDQFKRPHDAIDCFVTAIKLFPKYANAYLNLGVAYNETLQFERALQSCDSAISIEPSMFEAYYNRGVALYALNRCEEALASYEYSLSLNPNYAEAWNNRGIALSALNRHEAALGSYDRAIELKLEYAEAWNNRGVALNDLRRHKEALASYKRSIELKPDYAEAWNSRGNVLHDLKNYEEALASYEHSIELNPNCAEAWNNRGITLSDLKRYEDAIVSYQQALKLRPDSNFLLGTLVHAQMKVCDWANLNIRLTDLETGIEGGHKSSSPLPILGLLDNPKLQRLATEIYTSEMYRPSSQLNPITKRARGDKIRIGYFSMDFREHPVSYLTADLFELHDRKRFDVCAFSYGANTKDKMYQRLQRSFDKFVDVHSYTEIDIALLAREMKIDIAIDLGGHTKDSRPKIFTERAAPIQVNYLGYAGTWGHSCMNYFIGDKNTITSDNRDYFSERIIYMPHQFLVNPISRPISNRIIFRKDFGLPDEKIVFCCFNNSWKITPTMFACWMRILARVPGSVLWLYAENSSVSANLLIEASAQGISRDRLIFAERLPDICDHLARYQLADLFLDTLPYNAHTTASDALWAGLPVVTVSGRSFSSRVAASLLRNIGLAELITNSFEQYEALAIQLAGDPDRVRTLKDRLRCNRATSTLFDTPRFTRYLESAYQEIYDLYDADLPPKDVHIKSQANYY
jgi:predicted O-linked N-acetylglucosamine transferase (SPINDLY family)